MAFPSYSSRRSLVACLVCISLFAFLYYPVARAAEVGATRHRVPGLKEETEILVDRWGVPHIYARDTYDAFLAQGFNAARDRLWQIDLWRKRGLGQLAQDFGAAYVEQDRASRLMLFRGDMRTEWISYASDAKRIVESFVAGVNAYVQLTRENPELLPPEFKVLGYAPALWEPADVVRIRSHGIASNVASEVTRAHTVATVGLEVDAFRRPLQPTWQTKIPEGFNPSEVPLDVLRVYNLSRDPVRFTKGKPRKAKGAPKTGMIEESDGRVSGQVESNNFAVAASRSETGRAIFANDPHRIQGVPSLRYFAHLSAPGIEVVGAGEPFLPGISLGHNRTIAFGLTIFACDQEDLYVYETNPADPNQYRYRNHWEPMTVQTETIAVKGADAREVELKFTRHGPVLFEDKARHRAYALRAAWLQPGTAAYLSSLEYQRAANWDQFLAAMNRHGGPSLNYLYADTTGNIGWAPSALAPIRPNWDGLMPVPGDGRYEWAGFRTGDEFPRVFNPRAGWFGTSNEFNLPNDPKYTTLQISYEWHDPSRAQRQPQIFGGTRKMSVKDVIGAQTDITSVLGQRATALLRSLPAPADPATASALQTLRSWDHRAARDSVGATIFNVWFHQHLRSMVVREVLSAEAAKSVGGGSIQTILSLLEQPSARLGANPQKTRDELLLKALSAAVADLTKRYGGDQTQWQWGRLHHALFEHPLADLVDEGTRAQWNVGPVSKAGDDESLAKSSYRTSDFRLQTGGSARFVTDVGDWSNTWATNSPGQSADPRSPHYKDLFEDWAHDRYFPLLFERAAIEREASQRIVLQPAW